MLHSDWKALLSPWGSMSTYDHTWYQCTDGALSACWASQWRWKVAYSVTCIETAAFGSSFMSELLSLVFSWCHVLYSTRLPMCYCIHVKDGLPQLGYKKHVCGISEKTGTVCLPLPRSKSTVNHRASNFPTPSTSFWGIHEYVNMLQTRHTVCSCDALSPWNVYSRRANDFKGFCLAEVLVFRKHLLSRNSFPTTGLDEYWFHEGIKFIILKGKKPNFHSLYIQ